eukprot:Gb_28048 [translate_table: standard]
MAPDHPNYVTLEKAGLRSYFLLSKLFYEDHSITEAIAFTIRHPKLLQITDEVVHEVTSATHMVPTHLLTCKRFNWSGYIKLRLQRMLVNVGAATKQASFFMPFVFTVLLLNQFDATHLPILQGILEIPHMTTWCIVYKRGIFTKQQVEVIVEKLNVAGEEPQEDREVEVERGRKRKGKATVQVELEKPQPSVCHAPGHQANEFSGQWKMFEDGLSKDECRMENHELWRPTFTANVINILYPLCADYACEFDSVIIVNEEQPPTSNSMLLVRATVLQLSLRGPSFIMMTHC